MQNKKWRPIGRLLYFRAVAASVSSKVLAISLCGSDDHCDRVDFYSITSAKRLT
jgi:hypothetical protein